MDVPELVQEETFVEECGLVHKDGAAEGDAGDV